MNELEAINMLLVMVGAAPVNDAESKHPDVANAKTALNRHRKKFQRKGWYFNYRRNVELVPAEDGRIRFGKDISMVEMVDRNLIRIGDYLTNRVLNTSLFTTAVMAHEIIYIYDWANLPEVVQEHIAYLAAADFVRDEIEDIDKIEQLKVDATLALIEVRRQDLRVRQLNMWDNAAMTRYRANWAGTSSSDPMDIARR